MREKERTDMADPRLIQSISEHVPEKPTAPAAERREPVPVTLLR